jgi:integrase
VFYRTAEGRQRWHTIGRHGAPWTPETARKEAQRILGQVAGGGDPAGDKGAVRKVATVAELCDRYLEDAEGGRLLTRRRTAKKTSTLATDRGRIERHIKPVLGMLKVTAVRREDIERFLYAVAGGETATRIKTNKKGGLANVTGGRGTATRTVGLLGAIFTYALRQNLRADNPVHGVTRFADGKRARRLTDEEYAILGRSLRQSEDAVWPAAVAVVRFLALTGWRRGEVLSLKWQWLDLSRRTATLPDTKSGQSLRPLSVDSCRIIENLPRHGEFVFPATRGHGIMSGFPKIWARIVRRGGVPSDLTPHVLRHSFASLAADLGFSEPTIAALIGHASHSVTSRYVHSADAVLLAAADTVAERIALLMGLTVPAMQELHTGALARHDTERILLQ